MGRGVVIGSHLHIALHQLFPGDPTAPLWRQPKVLSPSLLCLRHLGSQWQSTEMASQWPRGDCDQNGT